VLVPLADVRKGAMALAKEIGESGRSRCCRRARHAARFADGAERRPSANWSSRIGRARRGLQGGREVLREKRAGNFKVVEPMAQVSGKAAIVTAALPASARPARDAGARGRRCWSPISTMPWARLSSTASPRPAARPANCTMTCATSGVAGVIAEGGVRNFGPPRLMVANAGIGVMSPIETMSLADWQRQQANQTWMASFPVDQTCLPALPARRRRLDRAGMSSIAGRAARRGLAAYSATKGGGAAAGEVGGDWNMAADNIRLQLGASRHHRHADLGQDPDRAPRANNRRNGGR